MYLTGQTHGSAPTGLLLFYVFVLFCVRFCIINFSARGGPLEEYSNTECVPRKFVFDFLLLIFEVYSHAEYCLAGLQDLTHFIWEYIIDAQNGVVV